MFAAKIKIALLRGCCVNVLYYTTHHPFKCWSPHLLSMICIQTVIIGIVLLVTGIGGHVRFTNINGFKYVGGLGGLVLLLGLFGVGCQ